MKVNGGPRSVLLFIHRNAVDEKDTAAAGPIRSGSVPPKADEDQ